MPSYKPAVRRAHKGMRIGITGPLTTAKLVPSSDRGLTDEELVAKIARLTAEKKEEAK